MYLLSLFYQTISSLTKGIVGVPGCGKSSILKEAVRQIPSLRVINYGDEMLKEAASEGVNRDMLRKMPVKAQQQIGIEAAKKIIQKQDGIAIIDTHALIRTKIGFCPGLPKEVLKILSPKACVWIECPPSRVEYLGCIGRCDKRIASIIGD